MVGRLSGWMTAVSAGCGKLSQLANVKQQTKMERKEIILLAIIAGITGLGIYFGIGFARQLQTTPDIQTLLIDYSDNFEPVRLQEIRNHTLRTESPGPHGQVEPFLIQIGEDIVYHEKNEGLHPLDDPIIINSLQRINATNGKIVWQQELEGIVTEVTNNAKYVFIAFSTQIHPAFDSVNNLVKPGAIKVTAFDIESGTVVWSGLYHGFSFTSYMDANEEIVAIHGHNGHSSFPDDIYIDAQTGDVTEEKLVGFGSEKELPSALSAKGIRSRRWGELSDGNLVVSTGIGIYAYNPRTESTLWELRTGLVVTDFAVDQDAVFFLTDDATLWAVDEISGQRLGNVQFTDTAFADEGPIADYIINTTDSGTITIFSRDTQYLFTFRFFN